MKIIKATKTVFSIVKNSIMNSFVTVGELEELNKALDNLKSESKKAVKVVDAICRIAAIEHNYNYAYKGSSVTTNIESKLNTCPLCKKTPRYSNHEQHADEDYRLIHKIQCSICNLHDTEPGPWGYDWKSENGLTDEIAKQRLIDKWNRKRRIYHPYIPKDSKYRCSVCGTILATAAQDIDEIGKGAWIWNQLRPEDTIWKENGAKMLCPTCLQKCLVTDLNNPNNWEK
jgi:hypothetical protein